MAWMSDVFPARWKDPAQRTSKCGKSCHSQDAQENERAIQPNRFKSEEHTSELQSQSNIVCRLLLEKKKKSSRRAAFSASARCGEIRSPKSPRFSRWPGRRKAAARIIRYTPFNYAQKAAKSSRSPTKSAAGSKHAGSFPSSNFFLE